MPPDLSILRNSNEQLYFSFDHRIDRTADVAYSLPASNAGMSIAMHAFDRERVARLRLQRILSSVWTDLAYGRMSDALHTLETEFPEL